ncbi:MAG: hypothetical protein HY549_04560 [Elusimicrobia bacterium]|nr:hypothetical protein [Elusimicrobiota bacterium]
MRRLLVLILLLSAGAGCARRLRPGPQANTINVEAEAEIGQSSEAALVQAQRQALERSFDLFLSSPALSEHRAALEEKILAKPRDYIERYQIISAGDRSRVRIRALLLYQKLAKDLDSIGVLRPDGVRGKPRLLISLRESGLGAGQDSGRASEALRRALVEKGYEAVDYSDKFNKDHQKSGELSEARAASLRHGAQLIVSGAARVEPLRDQRLEGYHTYRATLELKALDAQSGQELASVAQEASAVDLTAEAAAAKALANAGELAGERLRSGLGSRYQERQEISAALLGLGGLEEIRALIAEMRAWPQVAAVALDLISGRDARLKVFGEKLSADELAALLVRARPALIARVVENDAHYVELETLRAF